MSTYLIILIATLIFPLLLSFDKKVAFYKFWPLLIPSIAIPAIIFIVWDMVYTQWGVWSFNPKHLNGMSLFNLPIEEVLFFIVIPYVCLFSYEVINAYFRKNIFQKAEKYLSLILPLSLFILAIISYERLYTFVTFLALSFLLTILKYLFRVSYLNRFFFTYTLILVPFLIVNGLLTGTGFSEPVVLYNNEENLGLRLLTIPIEDVFYGMLLFLMNVGILEFLKGYFNWQKSL